jgi:hypothetical protein
MNVDASLLLQVLAPVAAAVGVYAGIRVDLARLYERSDANQKDAKRAHDRIDAIVMRGGRP